MRLSLALRYVTNIEFYLGFEIIFSNTSANICINLQLHYVKKLCQNFVWGIKLQVRYVNYDNYYVLNCSQVCCTITYVANVINF